MIHSLSGRAAAGAGWKQVLRASVQNPILRLIVWVVMLRFKVKTFRAWYKNHVPIFVRGSPREEIVMLLPGFQLAGMKLKEYKVDCGHGQCARMFYQPC